MVVHVVASSIIAVNKLVKQDLGWDFQNLVGAIVMCHHPKQWHLHTFHGMVGYFLKDAC